MSVDSSAQTKLMASIGSMIQKQLNAGITDLIQEQQQKIERIAEQQAEWHEKMSRQQQHMLNSSFQ